MLTSTQFSVPKRRGNYAEIPQVNPLRWTFYRKDGDKYTAQSGVMRCRDYFNDVVALQHGKSGVVYGFDPKTMKLNTEGMYILLTNCHDNLERNLEVLIGDDAPAGFGMSLERVVDKPGNVLLFLSHEFFSTTYYISYITLLIRAANCDAVMTCFADIKQSYDKVVENQYEYMDEYRMTLPDSVKQYWYLGSPTTHSGNAYHYASVIHDNGISGWYYAMEKM